MLKEADISGCRAVCDLPEVAGLKDGSDDDKNSLGEPGLVVVEVTKSGSLVVNVMRLSVTCLSCLEVKVSIVAVVIEDLGLFDVEVIKIGDLDVNVIRLAFTCEP